MYTTCPSKKLVDERGVERMCCAVLKGNISGLNNAALPFKTAKQIRSTPARQHAFLACISTSKRQAT